MIEDIIKNFMYNKMRSKSELTTLMRTRAVELDKVEEIANIILNETAYGIKYDVPLTSMCGRITRKVATLLDFDITTYSNSTHIRNGIRYIGYLDGYVKPEVRPTVKANGEVLEMTMLKSTSKDLNKYMDRVHKTNQIIDPTLGPQTWTGFELHVGGLSVDLVKKARRHGMQHHYTPEAIPQIYEAINRLQQTPFKINEWILELAEGGHEFNPEVICDKAKNKAMHSIGRVKVMAYRTKTVAKLEESEWYAQNHSVVSEWSKSKSHERIIEKANNWKGKACYFTYTLDTRSRMYPVQPDLNPQGDDIAKALLQFYIPQPLNPQTFAVVTANLAGRDKISFEDRVRWTEDNMEHIIDIGLNPKGMYHKLVEWEIDQDDKNRWQFLACCHEWSNVWKWVQEGNSMETYMTHMVSALDATCSALQIGTVISRDHLMAPHVNLVRQDRPGDVYKVSGTELIRDLKVLPEKQQTEGIQNVINHKSPRKVAKRPQMVADYSGSMQGMMNMTYTDRIKNGVPNLTRSESNIIGKLLYKITNDESRGSTKIKNFLRSGVQFHKGDSMITWKTPDGFTCFQVADKSKVDHARGVISGVKVHLQCYEPTGIPNKRKHKNLVCPNVTHSLDAFVVRHLAMSMPESAPLAMVHDSYGTSVHYTDRLLPCVLDAFRIVGDRDWYEQMVADMFNHHRPLPTAGKLTIEQIMEANYAIC